MIQRPPEAGILIALAEALANTQPGQALQRAPRPEEELRVLFIHLFLDLLGDGLLASFGESLLRLFLVLPKSH